MYKKTIAELGNKTITAIYKDKLSEGFSEEEAMLYAVHHFLGKVGLHITSMECWNTIEGQSIVGTQAAPRYCNCVYPKDL